MEENNKSKKKTILTIVATVIGIIVIIAVIGLLINTVSNNSSSSQSAGDSSSSNSATSEESKVAKLYDELTSKGKYNFNVTLDDNNKVIYAKDNEVAYKDSFSKGKESRFITTGGNAYLLNDSEKIAYRYQNNTGDLVKMEAQLKKTEGLQATTGKEKINNKNYDYEEYQVETEFLFDSSKVTNDNDVKTRFYFNGDNLVYVKTIAGDYEELSQVDINYKVDESLFELPSNYQIQ